MLYGEVLSSPSKNLDEVFTYNHMAIMILVSRYK